MSPHEFQTHALQAADAEGRLPLSRMSYWEIFPFDPDSLHVAPLAEPVLPEAPRQGEDAASCANCARRDEAIWRDEHWRLIRFEQVGVPLLLMRLPIEHHDLADLPDELARELGMLTVHLARAVEALANIARAHITRWGDGGAHLHVFVWARPAGQAQLRVSCLPVWDDLLPEYPDQLAAADATVVAQALAGSYGGRVTS